MAYNNHGSAAQQPDNYGTPYSNYGGTEQHEMQNYVQGSQTANVLSQQEFLSRISQLRSEINSLSTDVQHISQLHQAALSGTDDNAQRRLDDIVATTQHKNNDIRDQLRTLKADVEATPLNSSGASAKKRQWEVLNGEFQKQLQGYLQEEQSFKQRYRDQIARQYRIVNPDATEEQVSTAANMNWGDEGVFQSALRSNRTGQANAVLGNVRARHNELLEIEHSINELVNMIQDLDTIIVQQAPQVERVEEQVQDTVVNLEDGNKQIDAANKKARSRRKLKWICSGIVLLIVIGIALGVGIPVGLASRTTNAAANGGNTAKRDSKTMNAASVKYSPRRDLGAGSNPWS